LSKKSIAKFENVIFSDEDITIGPFSLSINEGDICHLLSSSDAYAATFLRGLATIIKAEGDFYFQDKFFDLNDYRKLLEIKRKVAYLGPHCGLMSNRSLKDNIFLFSVWEKNLTKPKEDEKFYSDCIKAGIKDSLNLRPSKVSEEVKCGTYIIKEFKKEPELILIERPYLFTRGRLDLLLREKTEKLLMKKIPLVVFTNINFLPYHKATHTISIEDNLVEKIER